MFILYLFQTNSCRTLLLSDLWWLFRRNFWPSQEALGSCWGERSEMHRDPSHQPPSRQCRSSATLPLHPYSHTHSPESALSWGGQKRKPSMSKKISQTRAPKSTRGSLHLAIVQLLLNNEALCWLSEVDLSCFCHHIWLFSFNIKRTVGALSYNWCWDTAINSSGRTVLNC